MASTKGYIALFICFSTKAIHLELVGDLTTKTFLRALTRFISNCGAPKEIWSDNGTNFHGANNELHRMLRRAELDWGLVEGELAKNGIAWKFIPPAAPHFGGLWEAGVKSAKSHLRRITGPRKLTHEEFSTLLAEIKMVLNSRPLTPLSGDLDDIETLTPAHFLVGGPYNPPPGPATTEKSLDHLTHWNLVRAMKDRFWDRWSREYLNTLQQRVKWTRPRPNLAIGDLVVLLDSSLMKPDGRWPLGRVIDVHPGDDGLVRVASVKTETGVLKRPVAKLARLPVSASEEPIPAPVSSS